MSLRWIFFKTPGPRQYDYKPLYYDPFKEVQSRRWQTNTASERGFTIAERSDGSNIDDAQQMRRERMSRAFRRRRLSRFSVPEGRSPQMLRTLVIALILALICYYLSK